MMAIVLAKRAAPDPDDPATYPYDLTETDETDIPADYHNLIELFYQDWAAIFPHGIFGEEA
jgi:hypothetical protein